MTKELFNDDFIDYTTEELNCLVSNIISRLLLLGEITEEEANVSKEVFNTLIMLVKNKPDVAEAMLIESSEFEEAIAETEREEYKKEILSNADKLIKMFSEKRKKENS